MTRFVLIIPLIIGLMSVEIPQACAGEGGDMTPRWSRLERSLEQGELNGRFVERTPGSYVLVPESRDLPAAKVLNPEQVAPASVGVRLAVSASYDLEKKGVRVSDYRLSSPSLPLGRSSVSLTPAATSPVARTMATFRSEVSRALKPGAMSADILSPNDNSTVTRAGHEAERQLRSSYREAVDRGAAGMADRRAAVHALADVRQELKAIYGTYDNYPPWSYGRIFTNAKSVVAIAESAQSRQALCSGVLLSTDLVLTAGHCFKNHHPKDLEVWFGFAETADRSSLPTPITRKITELVAPPPEKHDEFLDRAAGERFDAGMPDYAIVRIGTDEGETDPPAIAPQCLRQHNISRGRALYVVGYPKGTPEMVHDNARVYLPFRLRPRDFEKLKLEIEVDFANLEDEERLRLLEEFVVSYVQIGEGADRVFELYDTRWGRQPKFGIVADLFRGNSGSPVFDRNNHCVVGIHTGGATDTGQRLGASWQAHETALPITAILADLRKHPQTSSLVDAGILNIR